jgi:hypothetical protein
MYQDGGTVKEVKPLQQGLAGVLAIELPEGDFQQVSEAERDAIEERMELAGRSRRTVDKSSQHQWIRQSSGIFEQCQTKYVRVCQVLVEARTAEEDCLRMVRQGSDQDRKDYFEEVYQRKRMGGILGK